MNTEFVILRRQTNTWCLVGPLMNGEKSFGGLGWHGHLARVPSPRARCPCYPRQSARTRFISSAVKNPRVAGGREHGFFPSFRMTGRSSPSTTQTAQRLAPAPRDDKANGTATAGFHRKRSAQPAATSPDRGGAAGCRSPSTAHSNVSTAKGLATKASPNFWTRGPPPWVALVSPLIRRIFMAGF
jgi:hypothetical protein